MAVSVLALLVGLLVSRSSAPVARPRPQDVVRRDRRRHRRQLLREQVLDVSLGRVSEPRVCWWLRGRRVRRLIGLLLRLAWASTTRSSTIPAGAKATPRRSRATLRSCNYNIFFPQTEYNGPPPNYVELELQIVPFLAATLLQALRRARGLRPADLDRVRPRHDRRHGLLRALALREHRRRHRGARDLRDLARQRLLLAHVQARRRDGVLPHRRALRVRALDRRRRRALAARAARRVRAAGDGVSREASRADRADSGRGRSRSHASAGAARSQRPLVLARCSCSAFVPLAALRAVSSRRTPSGTGPAASSQLHVLPSLRAAFTSLHGFVRKALDFGTRVRMLATTMLGPVGLVLAVAGFCVPLRSHSGRAAVGLARGRPALRVRRRDGRARRLLPLPAAAARRARRRGVRSPELGALQRDRANGARRRSRSAALPGSARAVVDRRADRARTTRGAGASTCGRCARRSARARRADRDGPLRPVVHVLHRPQGWEEDPHLWTPFDEQSAIRKGARYFISVETEAAARATSNCTLAARFPLLDPAAQWPVYETDPAKARAGGRTGLARRSAAPNARHGRAWLDARKQCAISLVSQSSGPSTPLRYAEGQGSGKSEAGGATAAASAFSGTPDRRAGGSATAGS